MVQGTPNRVSRMLEQISIELALSLVVIVVAVVGWEWKKVLSDKKTEVALKKELQLLKDEMTSLHQEHAQLLRGRDGEHADIMRKMTRALDNLNTGIGQLVYYIKWLGEKQYGEKPPPPLPGTGGG